MNNWSRTCARTAVLLAAVLVAYGATSQVARHLTLGGTTPADVVVIGLLFALIGWLMLWVGVAVTGFVRMLAQRPQPKIGEELHPVDEHPPITAVVMPVYNEDSRRVFAGIQAMRESVAALGEKENFHFFVLSDSTNPDVWLSEEQMWRSVRQKKSLPPVYYRHRPKNVCRKAGNIADFCERWGAAYRFMIVLDADSLMEASVFAELVRRMEADRRLGILQTPPLPLGQASLLSRGQQFVARLCGPMLSEGLAWLAGDGGNYWGHNAILRVEAFTRYCGLSELPGSKPLGGEILSHDFVEAALMRRAGYKVQLAADLTGSYEQGPSTLTAYAARDQRWCQGNMQHTRLIFSKDIPLASRFHFMTGVFAYGSSPMWALFLVLSPLAFVDGSHNSVGRTSWISLAVFAMVMGLLILPRGLGYLLAISNRKERVGFGGPIRLALSTATEFAFSVLLAPILMTFHSLFVYSTLRGRRVEWNAQNRSDDGLSWNAAWHAHWWQSALGIGLMVGTAWVSLPLFLWMLPISIGLSIAIPLSVLISSKQVGQLAQRWGLLSSPEETQTPPIIRRFERQMAKIAVEPAPEAQFLDFLRNAQAVGDHVHLLEATESICPATPETEEQIARWLVSPRSTLPTQRQRWEVLCDPHMLHRCHVGLWVSQA